jgi:hypothetical protein
LSRICLLLSLLILGSCTSDPNAQVNQNFPIRQMDDFFRPFTGSPGPTPTDTHRPGYAPAYPPYSSIE